MEDILASIRRILNEDEASATGPSSSPEIAAEPPRARSPENDDVLLLDPSMMVPAAGAQSEEPPVIEMEPPSRSDTTLVGPEAARAAAASVSDLVRKLAIERTTQTHTGGPTIEDLVRAELRPILKDWLETHLPVLVERLVKAEIERVVGRATL